MAATAARAASSVAVTQASRRFMAWLCWQRCLGEGSERRAAWRLTVMLVLSKSLASALWTPLGKYADAGPGEFIAPEDDPMPAQKSKVSGRAGCRIMVSAVRLVDTRTSRKTA